MSALSIRAAATEKSIQIEFTRGEFSCTCSVRRSDELEWTIERVELIGDESLKHAAARVAVLLGEAIDEVEIGRAMAANPKHHDVGDSLHGQPAFPHSVD